MKKKFNVKKLENNIEQSKNDSIIIARLLLILRLAHKDRQFDGFLKVGSTVEYYRNIRRPGERRRELG